MKTIIHEVRHVYQFEAMYSTKHEVSDETRQVREGNWGEDGEYYIDGSLWRGASVIRIHDDDPDGKCIYLELFGYNPNGWTEENIPWPDL